MLFHCTCMVNVAILCAGNLESSKSAGIPCYQLGTSPSSLRDRRTVGWGGTCGAVANVPWIFRGMNMGVWIFRVRVVQPYSRDSVKSFTIGLCQWWKINSHSITNYPNTADAVCFAVGVKIEIGTTLAPLINCYVLPYYPICLK